MNQKEILTRAWNTLWNYKTLWVFGILLALTTSTFTDRILQFGDKSRLRDGDNITLDIPKDFPREWREANDAFKKLFAEVIPADIVKTAITVAVLLGSFILILIILRIFVRYISESAIITMVDRDDATGLQHNWREGLKIGWSSTAWKLFLIDLSINLPVIFGFIFIFAMIMAPMLLWATANPSLGILGTVMTTGLFVLGIFLVILGTALLDVLKTFFRRVCVLEERGVFESISIGFALVRRYFKDIAPMWLILIGINLGFVMLMIPIIIMIVFIAGFIGGFIGLTAGGITSFFANGSLPFIVGAIVGSPIFLLVLVTPLTFLSGLKETYVSTAWTLTFRELQYISNPVYRLDEVVPANENPQGGPTEVPLSNT